MPASILALAESIGGSIAPVTAEVIGTARKLADQSEGTVATLLPGEGGPYWWRIHFWAVMRGGPMHRW